MHAIICGGGVGGLSGALGLRRAGCEVSVYEETDALRTSGSGLNLWPNAGRAMKSLGVAAEYAKVAVRITDYRYQSSSQADDGVSVVSVADWETKYGAPATGVHRRALNVMLSEALGSDAIHYGHKLSEVYEADDGVRCVFEDGSEATGDLMIGADGIHSRTRACMFGAIPYRPNPFHAFRWRGLFQLSAVHVDATSATTAFGEGSFFGILPIEEDVGYWFASGPGVDDHNRLLEHFGAWTHTAAPATIAATLDGTLQQTRLLDLAELPETWTKGRIALLGDAAHAMMPDLAQGASTTLVDAAVLAECMVKPGTVTSRLVAYEQQRRPAANAIVYASRRGAYLEPEGLAGDKEFVPIPLRYERFVERGVRLGSCGPAVRE